MCITGHIWNNTYADYLSAIDLNTTLLCPDGHRRKSPVNAGFPVVAILTAASQNIPFFLCFFLSYALSPEKPVLGKTQYGFFSQGNQGFRSVPFVTVYG